MLLLLGLKGIDADADADAVVLIVAAQQ